MLAPFAPWLLLAAIGQAAPEAALLKAATADVDLAIRCRGLEPARDDLIATIKAMDSEWGNMAEGLLTAQVSEIGQRHGERAVKSPFLVLVRLPEAAGAGGPTFAVLLPADDYEGTLRGFNGGKAVELKHEDGGVDSFDGPEGQGTWYAAKRTGIVAFGPSKDLVAAIAKGPAKGLDSVLNGPLGEGFLGGEAGLYVNSGALTKRYADLIEQGRQAIEGLMDQFAQQQPGQAGSAKLLREMYAGAIDWFKQVGTFTYHVDFSEKSVRMAGFLKLTPGSDAAKAALGAQTLPVASLSRLPRGSAYYVGMNASSRTIQQLLSMSMRMMQGDREPSTEVKKATEALYGMGRLDAIGAVSMAGGVTSINEVRTSDPKGFVEHSLILLRAMGQGEGRLGIYKEVKIEPKAESIGGLAFTHAEVTIDMEKLTAMAGNAPGQANALKAMLGNGPMNYWYGVEGDRAWQVTAPNREAAVAMIEAARKPEDGVGQSSGFKAVASDLPDRASLAVVLGAQELARMIAKQVDAAGKKLDLKLLDDMPKEPAFAGASVTPRDGEGYEFRLIVPSEVGPVLARGLIPTLQSVGE